MAGLSKEVMQGAAMSYLVRAKVIEPPAQAMRCSCCELIRVRRPRLKMSMPQLCARCELEWRTKWDDDTGVPAK